MSKKRNYTYRSMRDEREYGPYWYSALWRIIRPILVFAGAMIVVIGVLYSVWNKVYDEFLAPADAASQQEIAFAVESGQSLTRVANNLEEAGLIRNHTVFKYYCDFAGMGQKIQVGSYLLKPSMTMSEIADQLTRGDGNPIVRNITMIPGWTIEDFANDLVSKGVLTDSTEFLELCRTGEAFSDYYYIADVLATKNVSQRRYVLEGYLSANTYEVYVTATAEDIIRRLLSQTERAFPADYQERAEELGYTMDQMLTLASLIEKEAKNSDFTKVSAVFHNRLDASMPLQSDVTIHYLTGVRKMNLTNSDLSVDSPYNTYKVSGLPLGPICSPSQAAINAALYPDETYRAERYLYFCAKDPESGELHFSRTLQEHEQAVNIYAPLWSAYDQSRGIQ
ncbi:MAG: endolytic transglycosylase MltG [Christensenellaceae bacterium]|nr:endolytic transglycosylase MltG [Christensenellaceae bacterium]